MTGIRETLRQACASLEAIGIETARLDAELLLAEAMGISRNILLLGQDRLAVDGPSEKRFAALLARRLRREPVAHILSMREFWSLDFKVSPATLIPRPDSETLVEAGLRTLAPVERPHILDLGVGSGCLLIALLHERRDARGVGVDASAAALEIARANGGHLGVAGRIDWRQGDWFAAVHAHERFQLIVSNPPYVARDDLAALAPDVAAFEPLSALDGGADGLDPYRILLPQVGRHLAPGGVALFEFGVGQGAALLDMAQEAGLAATLIPDLSGRPRCLRLEASDA